MNAAAIVKNLIEDGESPGDFLDRNDDLHVPTEGPPTHQYHFNIGEGSYRCGVAFEVKASSRREAVMIANKFLQEFFYQLNNGGSSDLPGEETIEGARGAVESFRVYVDDDIVATEQDIVDEMPLEGT